jgi:hypothetical protein
MKFTIKKKKNGLPGTRTRNRSDGVDNVLVKKEKTPPQTVLAFFIAHGFPYVYISNSVPFLGGTRTKLNTQWIQLLLYKYKHFSIEMNE